MPTDAPTCMYDKCSAVATLCCILNERRKVFCIDHQAWLRRQDRAIFVDYGGRVDEWCEARPARRSYAEVAPKIAALVGSNLDGFDVAGFMRGEPEAEADLQLRHDNWTHPPTDQEPMPVTVENLAAAADPAIGAALIAGQLAGHHQAVHKMRQPGARPEPEVRDPDLCAFPTCENRKDSRGVCKPHRNQAERKRWSFTVPGDVPVAMLVPLQAPKRAAPPAPESGPSPECPFPSDVVVLAAVCHALDIGLTSDPSDIVALVTQGREARVAMNTIGALYSLPAGSPVEQVVGSSRAGATHANALETETRIRADQLNGMRLYLEAVARGASDDERAKTLDLLDPMDARRIVEALDSVALTAVKYEDALGAIYEESPDGGAVMCAAKALGHDTPDDAAIRARGATIDAAVRRQDRDALAAVAHQLDQIGSPPADTVAQRVHALCTRCWEQDVAQCAALRAIHERSFDAVAVDLAAEAMGYEPTEKDTIEARGNGQHATLQREYGEALQAIYEKSPDSGAVLVAAAALEHDAPDTEDIEARLAHRRPSLLRSIDWLREEVIRQTGCSPLDLDDCLTANGHKPVVNKRMGAANAEMAKIAYERDILKDCDTHSANTIALLRADLDRARAELVSGRAGHPLAGFDTTREGRAIQCSLRRLRVWFGGNETEDYHQQGLKTLVESTALLLGLDIYDASKP